MPTAWTEALACMKAALKLLDESHAPPEIGARLEFTISNLEQACKTTEQQASPSKSRIFANSNHP